MSARARVAPDEHAGHQPSSRWPGVLALLVIGCLYFLLSDRISVGPRWLVPMLTVALVVPLVVIHRQGASIWTRRLARLATAGMTVAVGISATLIAYDAVL